MLTPSTCPSDLAVLFSCMPVAPGWGFCSSGSPVPTRVGWQKLLAWPRAVSPLRVAVVQGEQLSLPLARAAGLCQSCAVGTGYSTCSALGRLISHGMASESRIPERGGSGSCCPVIRFIMYLLCSYINFIYAFLYVVFLIFIIHFFC